MALRGGLAGLAVLTLAAVAGCGGPAPTAAGSGTQAGCPAGTPTITSQAYATASAPPNLLTVSMGVTIGASTAAGALAQDSARANALIASLRQGGVGDADMQTSLLSIQPTYSGGNQPVLTGYQASNEVTVKLHDLGGAGSLIDQAAKAAGNAIHIDSIAYSLVDDRSLMDQARKEAVARATAQAASMAAGDGIRLGPLCSVTDVAPPGYASGAGGAAAGSPGGFSTLPPIEAGTQQLSAQVTAVFRARS